MTTPRRLPPAPATGRLRPNAIACGDARAQTARIAPGTVDLALWSPPYLVGKKYERDLTLAAWTALIEKLFALHARVLRPGAFAVVNIADVLAWPDPALPPGPQAINRTRKGRITAGEVAAARAAAPGASNAELARRLGCSEQTIARRIKGNAHRTGRRTATRVLTTSTIIERAALVAGLYLYDHRIWSKTPAWKNGQWHASSYRAVDEWEHLLVFHLPGPFAYDRDRIDHDEWAEWGSRGICASRQWAATTAGRPRSPRSSRRGSSACCPIRTTWCSTRSQAREPPPRSHTASPAAGSASTPTRTRQAPRWTERPDNRTRRRTPTGKTGRSGDIH